MKIISKQDFYKEIKVNLEKFGIIVGEFFPIQYGLQFDISDGREKFGRIRIYEGKKGLKLDLSQIKNKSFLAEISNFLEVTKKNSKNLDFKSQSLFDKKSSFYPDKMIGVDESGKGDYFGPLVIAGVYVDQNISDYFRELGVVDSKKLSDERIVELAFKIKKITKYFILSYQPDIYNRLYEKIKNLNYLLADAHIKVIKTLYEQTGCKVALSDQFGKSELLSERVKKLKLPITIYQQPRAEQVLSVAGASILARDKFIKEMNLLSVKYKKKFYKGASDIVVNMAKEFIAIYGKEKLGLVAKLHFSITKKL